MKLIGSFLVLLAFSSLAPEGSASAGESDPFDHSLYDAVLSARVRDGRVDYRGMMRDRGKLDAYLEAVASLDPGALERMPRREQLAFYINVYNALTLRSIIDNYPVRSIRDIPGVWKGNRFVVAGTPRTLDEIEHEIIRKKFREPRIHFALVCAAKGCPKLRSGAYTGAGLNSQLDEEARRFVNDRAKVRLYKSNNTLYLSSIFKWFGGDFGDVREFVARYLPVREANYIRAKSPRLRYLGYDWTLNKSDRSPLDAGE